MNALIVEDEMAAQRNLCSVLAKVAPQIEVVATTESVTETVEWLLHNAQPDIIFMDIHLSDGHAFHIFDIIEVKAPVIFTTAYDQYALEAFKLNSIDYLLKPIKPNEVEHALNKLRRLSNQELIEKLRNTKLLPPTQQTSVLLVPFKDKIIPIAVEDVAFFYTTNERTQVGTTDGRHYPLDKSLDTIMGQLSEANFYRANRQFIVSRHQIKDIDVWIGSRLALNLTVETPERIIISKNRVAEFKGWIARKR